METPHNEKPGKINPAWFYLGIAESAAFNFLIKTCKTCFYTQTIYAIFLIASLILLAYIAVTKRRRGRFISLLLGISYMFFGWAVFDLIIFMGGRYGIL